MYIWKTGNLVEDLKSNKVTERNFKNYYLASSLLMMISYYLAMTDPPENMTMMLIEAIGSIGITVVGIDFVFKCNGGDNGANFINKALSLSFPLMIKVIVAGIFVGTAMAVMKEGSLSQQVIEITYTVLILLIQGFFFWRLAVHIQRANA
tara:strand:+ start:125 stop:574 length:450 start_codon:yes stop_codon:yes gene_type:complete